MTAIEHARNGTATEALTHVAKNEKTDSQTRMEKMARGKVVLPRNTRRAAFS